MAFEGKHAEVWTSGATPTGLMYRFMDFPKKDYIVRLHKHNYTHDTLIMQGIVRVHAITPDGREFLGDYKAPSKVTILNDVEHEMKAVSDDGALAVCIFQARDWKGTPTKDMKEMDLRSSQ